MDYSLPAESYFFYFFVKAFFTDPSWRKGVVTTFITPAAKKFTFFALLRKGKKFLPLLKRDFHLAKLLFLTKSAAG
jgi:hypothetical protein